MAKGKRQRANIKSSNDTVKKVKPSPVSGILKDYPVRALNAGDVEQLKQLVGLSNNIIKLMQQCNETDTNITRGNEVAKDMLKGKIKGPAMQKITPNLYLPLSDINGVAKKIKDEVKTLKKINAMSKLQLTQQYNQYLNTLRYVKDSFEQLLVNAPEQKKQVIFEKDISKLTKKDSEFLKKVKSNIDKKAKK